ncbi:MAG TPA: DegT/DnrJ/EryC1/StrS family aminotransferase [Solirubrobacterales bacterium]|nr:DegT/DnrJ/EryC1/StrS family aminotransferase [Solirubrobacterales bacterium]
MTEGLPPLDLARPQIGPEEERLVLEVLRSGRLSLGEMLERFEDDFANWLGVDDAVAVSSGTAALHLGVRALGWGIGDEVVLSPFTFVASANCLLYEGVRPVFADIDPDSLNLDPAAAEAAVTDATVGLLPIDIFGQPSAMPEFERIAAAHGLGILEDSCQALGAIDSEGRKVGSRGNIATFAFYANKQMTTGEGGMIVPADPGMAEVLRSERNQGRAIDMDWLDHDRLGFNYRMSDVTAAIGVAQVGRLDELLAGRARVAGMYLERLSGLADGSPEGLVLPASDRPPASRSWFVFPVRLPEGSDRDGIIRQLGEQGIPAKAYLPSIHLFPHLAELGYQQGQFPIAESVAARSLALPFHAGLSEGDVGRVADALADALE